MTPLRSKKTVFYGYAKSRLTPTPAQSNGPLINHNNTANMVKKSRNQKVSKNQNAIERIRGQGGYYTEKVVPFMRNIIPDGTFERFGGRLGGTAAAALSGVPALHRPGEALGQNLGRRIAKIAGFGDYSVKMNSLSTVGKAISPGESVPEFGTMGNAAVCDTVNTLETWLFQATLFCSTTPVISSIPAISIPFRGSHQLQPSISSIVSTASSLNSNHSLQNIPRQDPLVLSC